MNTPVGGTPPPPRPTHRRRPRRPASPPAARPRRRSRSAGPPPATTSASPATAATRTARCISSATGTSFTFTGLTCGTSYTLAVDAYDAAGNRSTRPSISASTQACPASPPVAAYSFDAATGTSLTDNSGSGNAGTISGATWTSAGKSGGALAFDGVNDIVTIADNGVARPDDRNDARGLGPPDREQHLADGRHQGDERQPRPTVSSRTPTRRSRARSSRSAPTRSRTSPAARREVAMSTWTHLAIHLRRRRAAPVRQRHRRSRPTNVTGAMAELGRPAPDRWQQRLGRVVPGPDRRPPRLQPCPHAEPAPDRHEHAGRAAAGRRHAGTVGSGRPGRQRPDPDRADAVLERLDRQRRRHRLRHLPQQRRSRHHRSGDRTLHLHRPHLRNRATPSESTQSTPPETAPRRRPPAARPAPVPAGDTQAPSAPAGLVVSGQTQTALTLSWNASTDNVGVTGYGTYRNSVAAGTTAPATARYTFTGLTCGTALLPRSRRSRRRRKPLRAGRPPAARRAPARRRRRRPARRNLWVDAQRWLLRRVRRPPVRTTTRRRAPGTRPTRPPRPAT